MLLYRDVDRVYNEMHAAGLKDLDEINAADLAAFDQYHYHGTKAIDVAINALEINSGSRVLEIGSGIGGPSRHIAAATGANIVALELQPDLSRTAQDLTQRCGLSAHVTHICADAMDFSPLNSDFDSIVSWLTFYHIEDRPRLLSLCSSWLKPAGNLFVEDLFARGDLDPIERTTLDVRLYARYLPGFKQYQEDFQAAGFSIKSVEDMSEDWLAFTRNRYAEFCRNRQRHEDVHGAAIAKGLDRFYDTVAGLFAGGNLGGIRLHATVSTREQHHE